MTVEDLISKLEDLPKELPVYILNTDNWACDILVEQASQEEDSEMNPARKDCVYLVESGL